MSEIEILFSSDDWVQSKQLSRLREQKLVRKVSPKVYTTNLEDPLEQIMRRNLYLILGHLFPGAVISHRSALEGAQPKDGMLVLSYKYTRRVQFPGITVCLVKSVTAIEGDTAFVNDLYLASRPRGLLENLQQTRGQYKKSLGKKFVEAYLDKMCRVYGEQSLNALRDEAKLIAPVLGLLKEYEKLTNLISALLSTKDSSILVTSAGQARSNKKPFDSERLELFAKLAAQLKTEIIAPMPQLEFGEEQLKNLAFFEAYFSNYIEGTRFDVEEAHQIIFDHVPILNRPEDAHDVLATYEIVSDLDEMQRVPSSIDELIRLLKNRHAHLMAAREDKLPGQFKLTNNKAGNTTFVRPELVVGSLEQGFELYLTLAPGIARAVFIMFLISEVHPFTDGNGRLARVMMNAELVSQDETRIIIPAVYREDYLLTLRRLSRAGDPVSYIQMLLRAQRFVNHIDFSVYHSALRDLKQSDAFSEPGQGKLSFE